MKKKKKNPGASCHFLGYLSDPEIELASPAPHVLAGGFFTTALPGKSLCHCSHIWYKHSEIENKNKYNADCSIICIIS